MLSWFVLRTSVLELNSPVECHGIESFLMSLVMYNPGKDT